MKKCLHILPMNKLSGAEKMALILCKNMQRYEPVVVCGGEELKEIFEKNNIKSYSIIFSNKRLFKTLNSLKKIIEENNIKLLHAHDNNASLNAYLVKKIYGLDIKIISHIHNCYPFLREKGINKIIDSFVRPRYDYNIACGKLVYDFYKENATYFNKDKTFILSNAIDIEEIVKVNVNKSEEVIDEFNIPRNKTILGFIGRLDEQKGIMLFIKEFVKYKDKFDDCIILLVGNGSQEEEIKSIIKELNLEYMFILTGFQDNVYKFYPIIDVFFLPSLYEGLPMVLLEAMAFKKSIISMDVGSINEIVKDEKTGILIESENYSKFIINLKEIKENDTNRKRLGNNAFEYIKNNYDIKNYRNIIEKIYDNQI